MKTVYAVCRKCIEVTILRCEADKSFDCRYIGKCQGALRILGGRDDTRTYVLPEGFEQWCPYAEEIIILQPEGGKNVTL